MPASNATSPGGRSSRRFAPERKPARPTAAYRREPEPQEDDGRPACGTLCLRPEQGVQVLGCRQYSASRGIARAPPASGKEDDLRGVEWHYLRRLATRFQAGRIADVQSLSGSRDLARRSIVGRNRGSGGLTIWDAATGAVRLHIADASAGYLAYTADGGTLISARGVPDARERLPSRHHPGARWDGATGNEIAKRSLNLMSAKWASTLSTADGTALLGFTPDAKLRVWDLAKGSEIATLDPQAADPSIERARTHFMALAPDRKTLVWQLGATTLVWDLRPKKSGSSIFRPSTGPRRGILTRRQTARLPPRRPAPRRATVGLERRQTGGRDARLCGPYLRNGLLAGWQSCSRRGTSSERFVSWMLPRARRSQRSRDTACNFSSLAFAPDGQLVVLGESGRLDPALEADPRPGPRSIRGRSRLISGNGRRVAGRSLLLHVFGIQTWLYSGSRSTAT